MPNMERKTGSRVGRKRKRTDLSGSSSGRPTKYHEKFNELVWFCSLGGFSIKGTCEHLGISRETFYSWTKKYPGFSDKWEEGQQALNNAALAGTYKRIQGFHYKEEKIDPDGKKTLYKKYALPDGELIKFTLDRRHPSYQNKVFSAHAPDFLSEIAHAINCSSNKNETP